MHKKDGYCFVLDSKLFSQIEYLFYLKDGKPLALQYYYKLKVNKDFVLPPQGKLLNLDLEVIMMPNLISVQSNKKELKS